MGKFKRGHKLSNYMKLNKKKRKQKSWDAFAVNPDKTKGVKDEIARGTNQ